MIGRRVVKKSKSLAPYAIAMSAKKDGELQKLYVIQTPWYPVLLLNNFYNRIPPSRVHKLWLATDSATCLTWAFVSDIVLNIGGLLDSKGPPELNMMAGTSSCPFPGFCLPHFCLLHCVSGPSEAVRLLAMRTTPPPPTVHLLFCVGTSAEQFKRYMVTTGKHTCGHLPLMTLRVQPNMELGQ